jgi:hypothetical protein
MIAGVKGSAVLSALLILLPWGARAADDVAGAVRELARKTVALAGRGEPVSISWRNLSSLASGDFNQVRTAFDGAVRDAGGRVSERKTGRGLSYVEVRLTLRQSVAVSAGGRSAKGERIARSGSLPETHRACRLACRFRPHIGKKLIWEQEEPILDVAMLGPGMLVLSPSRVSLQRDTGTQSLPLTPTRPCAARFARTSAGQWRRLQSVPRRRL